MKRVVYSDLQSKVEWLYQKWGFTKNDSKKITDVLLLSDLFGIESHGVHRLKMYKRNILSGRIKINAKLEHVKETDLTCVIDAHQAMGQIAGTDSMELAIKKAEKNGIGIVTTRNSNHYGIAGFYAKMASSKGLIGISCTNTGAIMLPTFAKKALIGSNPLAFAFPLKGRDFLYDASSTVVSKGKVEIYRGKGQELPGYWGKNSQGENTNDPDKLEEALIEKKVGGLFPLGGENETNGGHKGFGLGLIVEILTGILSDGYTSDEINIGNIGGASHFFLALDLSLFGNQTQMEQKLFDYFMRIKMAPRTDDRKKIYIHGEKEQRNYEENIQKGIPVNESVWTDLLSIFNEFGIENPLCY